MLGIVMAIGVAASAAIAGAQQNLGFESTDEARGLPVGWSFQGPADAAAAAADAAVAAEGERSLKVERTSAAGATRVTQRLAASSLAGAAGRAKRVRLSGYVRVAAGALARPSLWLRIDGAKGPLYLDSDGVSGAAPDGAGAAAAPGSAANLDWQRYEVELPWPPDVKEIALNVDARNLNTI